LQFELPLAPGRPRGHQQDLGELAGVERVAERRGAVGVADDRLAELEPGPAQRPRRPLGAGERLRPAGGEIDRLLVLAGGQRRDQQRVGDGAATGVAAQLGDQSRVLGGAGGDDQRLPAIALPVAAIALLVAAIVLLVAVIVDLHLGLLGRWLKRPSRERSITLLRGADRELKRG
jgi:hypothetical protein